MDDGASLLHRLLLPVKAASVPSFLAKHPRHAVFAGDRGALEETKHQLDAPSSSLCFTVKASLLITGLTLHSGMVVICVGFFFFHLC